MKVVLFCGGLGTRMWEYSQAIPKPLVPIGPYPIIWYVMKYYAHFGHRDFILCLGHKGDLIRSYFDGMRGQVSNDFIVAASGSHLEFPSEPIDDWNITFVDTGLEATVGERLRAVRSHVGQDEIFLANYTDGLSDVALPMVIKRFEESGKTACFVSVRPRATFHLIEADASGNVSGIEHIRSCGARINGGFFVLRRSIFEHIKEGEDLVEQPFRRLIQAQQLFTVPHDGFWACMDTFREKQELEDMLAKGDAPWMLWNDVR